MEGIVVDGWVRGVGVIGQVADVLKTVERGMGVDGGLVEKLVGLVNRIAIDKGIFGNFVRYLCKGRNCKRKQGCSQYCSSHGHSGLS
ncbi:hypothetical protein D3C87_1403570 [compost metagenome]